MGGLVVQILLARGLGAGPSPPLRPPPRGVAAPSWSFLRSNWGVISPFVSADEPILLSLEEFAYAFVHTLPPDEQRAIYEAHLVPESRRVGRGPLTDDAIVDFDKPRAPLLLIAGAEDHIIPAALNRANLKKYAHSPAVTELKEFPGRTHYILGQQGWEEVADHALTWAREHARSAP
jgi:pimeloyl-ACP methyl ester carboxylesterase